ncbi:hypothetical protein DSL72_002831 [Monilinia vaccinii-corymbosi]|uniref:Uncharacterized protein n=1 Tax=Monilinia vaccinii-corymbosi TaxID=61207 RepID=A0A8A3PDV7_9HELO|nr:hypothetical protein DSL72_002831 [Monilinia vaccinii-corymbosi]
MYLDGDTNTFNQSLVIRDARECATGQLWYVCNASNFQGCCSVDACSVSKCPDSNTAEVGASGSSEPFSSTTPTPTTITTPTISSQTTIFSQPTLQAASPITLLITTTVNNTVSTSSSSSSSSPPSSSPTIPTQNPPVPSSNLAPIIAGAVVGAIAIMCLAMAAFCYFRFRQKKKQDREMMFEDAESPDPDEIQFFTTTGKTLPSPITTKTSKIPSGSGLAGMGLGDVFAPLGGKARNSSTHKTSSPPGAPAPTMTQIQIPAPVHSVPAFYPSPIAESPEDYEADKPLSPDPEKSTLAPPPESSHPAFHPLPGMAGTRPAYRPGMGFAVNELDGREVDHVPLGTAGGRRRRSGSRGEMGGRSEGSGSKGVVGTMSTPSFSSAPPVPQGQSSRHMPPNVLQSGQPTNIQSQHQLNYRRGNSHSNNGSGSGSESSHPNIANPSQKGHTPIQYLEQKAHRQYQRQVAQVRRMNAPAPQNPYPMYVDSREHQQNMGYQNALDQAQESEREQSQSQSQVHAQRAKRNEGDFTRGEDQGVPKRKDGTHSIHIGLGLEARPHTHHKRFGTSPPTPSTSAATSQCPPQPKPRSPPRIPGRKPLRHEDNARMQVQANIPETGTGTTRIPPPGHPPSAIGTATGTGSGNTNQAGKSFEHRAVGPAPPPPSWKPAAQNAKRVVPTERPREHILSWAEYDGGGKLGVSAGLDGKGKGKGTDV